MRKVPGLLACLTLLAAYGSSSGGSPAGMSEGEKAEVAAVALYCSYGSESRAQFKGCTEHVSPERVLEMAARQYGPSAAKFALGTRDCGYDSGPMCETSRARIRQVLHAP